MKWQTLQASCIFLLSLVAAAFVADQSEFDKLAIIFVSSFVAYYILCFTNYKIDFKFGILLAITARVIFIPSFPALSDDIYRFFWDGQLVLQGISPFSHTPLQLFESGLPPNLTAELFTLLNSPHYYSVYPPISQGVFALIAYLSFDQLSVFCVLLKSLFLLAECGTIYFIVKLLLAFKLPKSQSLFYALNPLIILEGIGNLHFEVLMTLFVVWGLYLLLYRRWIGVILCIAVSIAIKMVSAILWPFLIPWLGFKRWFIASIGLGVITILLFYPLWDYNHLIHFTESLNLYFRSFEFNGSIYYVAREIGMMAKGYNLIAWIGPFLGFCALSIISLLLICNRRFNQQKTLTLCTVAFIIHLVFSTTVHPWYIFLPIAISSLTRLRHVFIWSSLIWLSYYAYQFSPPIESTVLLSIEYIGLVVALYLDRTIIVNALNRNLT